MAETKEKTHNKVIEILKHVQNMSSKFSEVGRNIVFAIIAGYWVLYNKDNNCTSMYMHLSLLFAFIYLLIDLIYYGSTMITYHRFLTFKEKESTVIVEDEREVFKKQRKCQNVFMKLTIIKIALLFSSIVLILIHVLTV